VSFAKCRDWLGCLIFSSAVSCSVFTIIVSRETFFYKKHFLSGKVAEMQAKIPKYYLGSLLAVILKL